MARPARQETDLYTMEYDEEIDTVVYYWEEYASGERFRDGAEQLLTFIKEQDAEKLIVNTRGIKAHDEDDQRWLQENWVPRLIDAGVEYSVTVHRDSVVSEMDMETFHERVADMGYDATMTADMDEAREWIASK